MVLEMITPIHFESLDDLCLVNDDEPSLKPFDQHKVFEGRESAGAHFLAVDATDPCL